MYSILLKIFNVGVNFSCIYQTPWSRSTQHHHQHDQSPHSKKKNEKKNSLGWLIHNGFFFVLGDWFLFFVWFFFFWYKMEGKSYIQFSQIEYQGQSRFNGWCGPVSWSIDNIVLMMSRGRRSWKNLLASLFLRNYSHSRGDLSSQLRYPWRPNLLAASNWEGWGWWW